jgi:hypothetical protein
VAEAGSCCRLLINGGRAWISPFQTNREGMHY